MPHNNHIDVTWGNTNETYMLWQFYGNWDGETYFISVTKLWKMMDAKALPFHLLIDMRLSGKSPSNLTTLMQAALRKKGEPCKIDQIVVLTKDNFWESLYSIASQRDSGIAGLNVSFARTDEEAAALLSGFEDSI